MATVSDSPRFPTTHQRRNILAKFMPRLTVEVMKDEGSVHDDADKLSVAGPRRDAPPIVLTL